MNWNSSVDGKWESRGRDSVAEGGSCDGITSSNLLQYWTIHLIAFFSEFNKLTRYISNLPVRRSSTRHLWRNFKTLIRHSMLRLAKNWYYFPLIVCFVSDCNYPYYTKCIVWLQSSWSVSIILLIDIVYFHAPKCASLIRCANSSFGTFARLVERCS